jgi:hypothetical protein
MLHAADLLADQVATLLVSLTPPTARRAERLLSCGDAPSEAALGDLLRFHQEVAAAVSTCFAFALPCGRALCAIARHAPPLGVVEVGAGAGLWAALLRRRGVPVHAYDCKASLHPFGRVECADAEFAAAHANRALLLCWPSLELELRAAARSQRAEPPPPPPPTTTTTTPPRSPQPPDDDDDPPANLMALRALRAHRGDTLLYVGEWRGASGLLASLSWRTACGHTAGSSFQAEVEAQWLLVEQVALPRWPGFTDCLYVFRRRGAAARDTCSDERWLAACAGQAAREAARDAEMLGLGGRGCLGARLRQLDELGLARPAAVAAAALLHNSAFSFSPFKPNPSTFLARNARIVGGARASQRPRHSVLRREPLRHFSLTNYWLREMGN